MKTYYRSMAIFTKSLFIVIFFLLCLINSHAMAGWVTETVDSAGKVGEYTSLAFDPSGNPAISYYNATNGDLKYAHFNGSLWDITTVDSTGNVGRYTSLALDKDENPAISYFDVDNGDLKFAHFNGTTWSITTVDSEGIFEGGYTSISFDASGNPAISYYNIYPIPAHTNIKYAHFNGSSWDITTVDFTGDVVASTSLAFDASDNPTISYYDFFGLRFAHFNGTTWVRTTVDSSVGDAGGYASLAFDSSGNPAISYYDQTNGDLKFAYFNGTTWSITTVDSTGDVGKYVSLIFDASNNPAISYYDKTSGDLKFAHFNGTTWSITTVDSTGNVGRYTSLALDKDENPAISYFDVDNGDLKFAHFSDTLLCQCFADSLMGCISGTVTKFDTGVPPHGGKIVILQSTTKEPRVRKRRKTDSNGCYRFADLEDGTYAIWVKHCSGSGKKNPKIVGIVNGAKVNGINFECE